VFQQLNHAVAVADGESLEVLAENARFFQLFPPPAEGGEDRIDIRIADLNVERLRDRLGRGRPFSVDREVKAGARTVSLAVDFRAQTIDGGERIVVEARDVSKQREAEYMLDSYSRLAERRARELEREKERVEKLLLNLMPRTVYNELRDFGSATPQRFEAASVLMLDFVGFTEMAVARDPSSIVAELNDIFSAFDRISELFGCERIKTIGDAYMAVSGVPDPNVDHATNVAKSALRFRRYLEKRNAAHPTQWRCRIGIHTGPLIGSLVGIQKYVYDVFGPAVNLASRLEQFAEPMQICLTGDTQALLNEQFRTEELGEYDIRGFGTQQVFALVGERSV
jgi:class 3 adenylate cyclase